MTRVFALGHPVSASRGRAGEGLEILYCRWKFKRFGPI